MYQYEATCQNKQIKYSKFFYTFYYPGPLSIVVGAGTSAYRGNLCGRPECNTFKPSFNLGLQYKLIPHIAVGIEVNYLTLSAFSNGNYENITFSSNVAELRGYSRIYFNDDKIRLASDKRKKSKFLKVYFLTGVSGIYRTTNSEIKPSRLSVNKISKKNSSSGITFGVPVGGGLHCTVSPIISLIGEITYVTTFTDRIDNVDGQNSATLSFLDSYGCIFIKLQISPFK